MKITMDEEYATRDGREVKIFEIDVKNKSSEDTVYGKVLTRSGKWIQKTWK